jgi:integrase
MNKRLEIKSLFPEDTLPAEMDHAITLSDFFDREYYPYAKATKRRPELDKFIFDKHIRPQLGRFKLTDITPNMLDRWVLEHIKQDYKSSTINKHIFLMNRLLNVAEHWGFVEDNRFKRRKIKQLRTGDHVQRFLSEQEIQRLMAECRKDHHPHINHFVKLLLLTGARKSEARLMKWGEVNTSLKIWTVPLSKNGKKRRITLSASALEVLDQIARLNKCLGLGAADSDYVFINPKTHTAYQSFYAAWHRIRYNAGLHSVRIHDLRHTYASLLINKGASIYEVQKLLGHHHISMTERYAHLLPDTLQQRVNLLSDIIN